VVLGTDQEVVIIPGKLEVDTLGVAGNQHLCLNNNNRLAPCSSSLRYKTDLRPFAAGMAIINRLQPITSPGKTAECVTSASALKKSGKLNRYL